MSNRKESIKKALGITAYPWSSDDEEVPNENQGEAEEAGVPIVDVIDTPQDTDAAGSSGEAVPPRRQNTRYERDLFWSILNNPNGMSPYRSNRPSGNFEPQDSALNRMLAIGDLRRLRRPITCSHPPQRSSRSPRRNVVPQENSSRIIIKRRITPYSQNYRLSGSLPGTSSRNINATHPLAVHILEETRQDETENVEEQERSISPVLAPADGLNDNIVLETDAPVGVSLEEEIVEIDVDGEGDANVANNDNDTTEAGTPALDNQAQTEEQPTPRREKTNREASEEVSEANSVKDFNQKLLRLLECPVCLEWMEAPLSQCQRGHLVCGRCRVRLTSCPLCRTPFSAVRNRAMEAVAELVRYPCRHGCGRETRLRRRVSHEANCPARRYRCPAPACTDRAPLPLSQLRTHCHKMHPTLVKVGRPQIMHIRLNVEQNDNWLLMCLGELFHVRVDVDMRRGVIVYVAFIGPMAQAKEYIYEVTVVGSHNDRKLVYTRGMHSDLEWSSLNFDRKDCFHLPIEHALNFLRVKNRQNESQKLLEFTVDVQKKQPRVTNVPAEPDS